MYEMSRSNLCISQGCIKCIRSPAMAMDQIEMFCPFPDWLKKSELYFCNQSENLFSKKQRPKCPFYTTKIG